MKLTFRYRVKDSSRVKQLEKLASSVNFVWNYCNEWSAYNYEVKGKFLSKFDLNTLTYGCSKELGLHSHTIQAVCEEYVTRRQQFKKVKLNWRSYKRSLGWIPFKASGVKVTGDVISYCGIKFKFWNSRKHKAVRFGSFTQDARGRWYVNMVCDVPNTIRPKTGMEVGIDLGLKTIVTCSDGQEISRENLTHKYEAKLAMARRARKKRLVASIHAKIKNSRKDFNHKETTNLVKRFDLIRVGNVSSSKLVKTKMAKSVNDASWFAFKSMLEYKSTRVGVDFKVVNESFSTVTCSVCGSRCGPSGLSALGIREWTCEHCNTFHKRDVNSATNILRTGRCAPLGNPLALV